MDLSRIIIGQVVTEKSERLKAGTHRTYTLVVAPFATKIEVKSALKRFYNVDARSVRILKVQPKTRTFGAAQTMEKRHRQKRALVTLASDSKALDLTAFRTPTA